MHGSKYTGYTSEKLFTSMDLKFQFTRYASDIPKAKVARYDSDDRLS